MTGAYVHGADTKSSTERLPIDRCAGGGGPPQAAAAPVVEAPARKELFLLHWHDKRCASGTTEQGALEGLRLELKQLEKVCACTV